VSPLRDSDASPLQTIRLLVKNSSGDVAEFTLDARKQKQYSVGREGDISLRKLDIGKHLYSPHAFITFIDDKWYLRSSKGQRTGKRALRVNGKLMDSSTPEIRIQHGYTVSLGDIVIEVKEHSWEQTLKDDRQMSAGPPTGRETWDLFVCHASEDKNEIARPLARALTVKGLTVWYDEFTLTLGDSLSESIDHGLANSRFGIVILSPSFFGKEWPRRELDGLTAKEIRYGKTILPIWHNVDRDFVLKYSPVLAGKLAVSTDKGLDKVIDEILKAISKDRSKVGSRSLVSPPAAESTRARKAFKDITSGAEVPPVRIREEVIVSGTHLSLALLWCKETAICVDGPYRSGFYTFTAKPGMKFIVIVYRFQNNWKREQTTPYLEKGEITTHRGYIYSVWNPPAGVLSEEYGPRKATDEEVKNLIGTSGAFEKLLPEESCVGCVAFEIPKDATPVEAVLFEVPLAFRFDK